MAATHNPCHASKWSRTTAKRFGRPGVHPPHEGAVMRSGETAVGEHRAVMRAAVLTAGRTGRRGTTNRILLRELPNAS